MTGKPKRPRDANQLAKFIADVATGEVEDVEPKEKSAAHQKGGKAGGKARAEALTPEERREIARRAAKARWKD
jgi:ubiquinone biosynthesis protein UbiJ